ncbi:MAG: GIY-YIG nuclease family protein [Ruminococcaceae bacterium]|nr:GIY-YIG nuclease family protein [Oscillospiraceae bacterium]
MTNSLKKYYTYLLECSDGTLYCGYSPELQKRLKVHNSGKGAKYTKARLPVTLVYSEEFDSKSEAMRREWEIKKMSRSEKLNLFKKQVD